MFGAAEAVSGSPAAWRDRAVVAPILVLGEQLIAGENPQLDEFGRIGIQGGQLGQRLIEVQQISAGGHANGCGRNSEGRDGTAGGATTGGFLDLDALVGASALAAAGI